MITADFMYRFNQDDISDTNSYNELLKNKLHNYITFDSIKITKFLSNDNLMYIASFYDEKGIEIIKDVNLLQYGFVYFNFLGIQLVFQIEEIVQAYFDILEEKTNYIDILNFEELKNKLFSNQFKEVVNLCTDVLNPNTNKEVADKEIKNTNVNRDIVNLDELKEQLKLKDEANKILQEKNESLEKAKSELEKEVSELNETISNLKDENAMLKSKIKNEDNL